MPRKLIKLRLMCGFALAGAIAASPALADSGRGIVADMAHATGPRDMAWKDCVGADHPGILLRKDNLAQLKLVHEELGFKYIRFHGIFHDDMEAYREVDGKPVYNFAKIDAVYAAILKLGMKPLVELGFMPHDLASGTKTIFYWKGNGSPPKDWGKWSDFITAFTRHMEARFGAAEVRNWRFEVWNEPNLDGFWTDGNQEAYFKLYDTTVKAIKAVDPALPVGGPVHGRCGVDAGIPRPRQSQRHAGRFRHHAQLWRQRRLPGRNGRGRQQAGGRSRIDQQ